MLMIDFIFSIGSRCSGVCVCVWKWIGWEADNDIVTAPNLYPTSKTAGLMTWKKCAKTQRLLHLCLNIDSQCLKRLAFEMLFVWWVWASSEPLSLTLRGDNEILLGSVKVEPVKWLDDGNFLCWHISRWSRTLLWNISKGLLALWSAYAI